MDAASMVYKFIIAQMAMYMVMLLISADMFFGPMSPMQMVFWLSGVNPVGEWFARFCGMMILVLLSGPLFFNVPVETFMKQSLILNVLGFTQCLMGMQMPEAGYFFQVQFGVAIFTTLANLYVVLKNEGYLAKIGGGRGRSVSRGKSPAKSPSKSPMKKSK